MDPATVNREARDSDDNGNKPKKISPWRFVWIGITLAALLWFLPNIHLKKSLRFTEVEFKSGSISQSEYDSILISKRRYFLACKIGSSVLLLGSILYLISQFETRRPAGASQRAKAASKPDTKAQ